MPSHPTVTVVMPVYNGERYLAQAIESILTQTLREFIFFIIDDGSKDNSWKIISRYAAEDTRIQSFHQANAGLIATLNKYFAKAETKYVARMDCDDISLPNRLQRQLDFLETHPEIGILGSCTEYRDESLEQLLEEMPFPESHARIIWKMLYTGAFSHPSIMMQKRIFDSVGGYSHSANHVEDYDFFIRAKDITQFANLRETLLIYRKHNQSVSHLNADFQNARHFDLSKNYIHSYNPRISDDAIYFLKYHKIPDQKKSVAIYHDLEKLHVDFIKKYTLSRDDRKFIYRDLVKHLSILALTCRNSSLVKGLYLYAITIVKAPWIIMYNLKNKK